LTFCAIDDEVGDSGDCARVEGSLVEGSSEGEGEPVSERVVTLLRRL
jgi:hypothetical protein